jgi:hypothetical protein
MHKSSYYFKKDIVDIYYYRNTEFYKKNLIYFDILLLVERV